MNKIIFRAKPKASKEALYGMDEIKQFTKAVTAVLDLEMCPCASLVRGGYVLKA